MSVTAMGPGALVAPRYQQAEQETKREGGKAFHKADYAYTPGGPSTWKLRLTNTPGGAPDPHIVGAAVAALGKGFRGQRVQIPSQDLGAVKAKVRRAWHQANPKATPDDVPDVLKASNEMAGVAPPGWEPTVKKMKRSGEIDNPYALAWYMKNRGMAPAKHEHDASYDPTIVQAQAELQGRQMPRRCLEAAQGDSYAMTQCLQTMLVPERRW